MQRINRPQPQLPVTATKTYSILAPADTHHRVASCQEVDCEAQAQGFILCVDEASDLGRRQAHYIRKLSGRPYSEMSGAEAATQHPDWGEIAPTLTVFAFPPGAECFKDHHVLIDRPEILVVRDGDHRGNPTGRSRVHTRGPDWVEDFAEHQDRLARRHEQG